MKLDDDQVHVTGSGSGAIDKATVAGFPTSEPIDLSLVTEDGRLKFRSRDAAAKTAMVFAALALIAPARAVGAAARAAPVAAGPIADTAYWHGCPMRPCGPRIARRRPGQGLVHRRRLARPQDPEAEWRRATLKPSCRLQDVDLGELLRRLEVKLPFPVEGQAVVPGAGRHPDQHAARPEDLPRQRDGRRCRASMWPAWRWPTFDSRLRFEKGILELQELKGKAVSSKGDADAAGTFEGTARMEVAPLGDLSGDVHVDHFPLDVVLNQLPGAVGKADGAFSGHVEPVRPANTLTDPDDLARFGQPLVRSHRRPTAWR